MSDAASYYRKCKILATDLVQALDQSGRSSVTFQEASDRLKNAIESRPGYTDSYESSWSAEAFVEMALQSPDRGYWTYAADNGVAYFVKMPEMTVHAVGEFLGPTMCVLPERFRDWIADDRFRTEVIDMIANLWSNAVAAGVLSGRWQKEREFIARRALSQRSSRKAPLGSKPAVLRKKDARAAELAAVLVQMDLPFNDVA